MLYEYNERFYRNWVNKEKLVNYAVKYKTSDLLISSSRCCKALADHKLSVIRKELEDFIVKNPEFEESLEPIFIESSNDLITRMCIASSKYDVGPMATVAGLFAEIVGKYIERASDTVIVENGGDIYAKSKDPITFKLYAGNKSDFSKSVKFQVRDIQKGIGVCTSSGVVGPSLSFGKADAVVAISKDTALADAAATSIANRIKKPSDIERVVNDEAKKGILEGLIACKGDKIAMWGNIQLVK
jgi:ApbE superfamily uncharacterized protein (UPF0280 family)